MKDKILFFTFGILFILSVISLATAEIQTLGIFKQGGTINLIQTCTNSTYSNISRVVYPNSSFAINSENSMTKTSNNYNYSFSLTTTLGNYIVYGNCDENGLGTNWVYDLSITPTGDNRGFSLMLILAIFGVVIFIFGWYEKNVWLVYIAGMIFMMLGVYTMIYGFNNINDLYTQTIAIVGIGLGIIFTIVAIYEQAWGGDFDSGSDIDE